MKSALEWIGESGDRATRPVYAVFGDDSYLIRESIRAVARAFFTDEDREAAISRFPGPIATAGQRPREVCTLPFFSRGGWSSSTKPTRL